MASADYGSGVGALHPANRWVFLCYGSNRCRRVHKASDTRKLVVTLFTGARGRRFLICTMTLLYHIPVIRIGSKTRIATVQNYFFPRLEILLRFTLEMIQEIYDVNPYEKMTFVYYPSNNPTARQNRDFH